MAPYTPLKNDRGDLLSGASSSANSDTDADEAADADHQSHGLGRKKNPAWVGLDEELGDASDDADNRGDVPTSELAGDDDNVIVVTPEKMKRRKKIRRFLIVYTIAIVCIALFLVAVIATSKSTYPESYKNGAVAADVPQCSVMGTDILRRGGNAVDAAVTTALCVGVVNGESSGIGGGGFMLVYNATTRLAEVVDFREMAPAAARQDMFRSDPKCLSSDASERRFCASRLGGLASGVPGELKGLEVAWQRHGRMSWSDLVMPAAALAKDGFPVSNYIQRAIEEEADIARPALLRLFQNRDGQLLREGEIMRRPNLAATLTQVAENGTYPFYHGEIAQRIIQTLQNDSVPGVMTLEDLANYEPIIRQPLISHYRDTKLYSAPAPASGSVASMILNILSRYQLGRDDQQKPLTTHRINEAFRFAYAKRTELGDPCCELPPSSSTHCTNSTQCSRVSALQQIMLDEQNAIKWRNRITDDRTHHNVSFYGAHYDMEPTPGTTHFSIVDKDGNAVAMTSTVNLYWGSKVLTPDGIIMNNEMDDFATPGVVNAFGVYPSPANFVQPFKRPLSSSAPVVGVATDGRVKVVAGASGGTKITTATSQVILNLLSFELSARDAVRAPRIHDQLLPDETLVEPGISQAVRDGLLLRGHNLTSASVIAVTQAVYVDEQGLKWPASDMRKGGQAYGY